MKEKRNDPATSEAMRKLYQAESERLGKQIAEMDQALEEYHSPEKLTERETAREQAWGKVAMDDFRNGDAIAATWLSLLRSRAGDSAWLFEEAELEADGYERFTTDQGESVWRRKPPASTY